MNDCPSILNMPISILVGIAGPAGSGKSTISNMFKEHAGYKVLAFAHPLKQALIKMTGLDRKWFYDIKYKEREIPGLPGITPRIMMQKFGTEYAREMIAPDFWLWRMNQSISKYSNESIIIEDVRFHNEAAFIRNNGGLVLHINRKFKAATEHTDHKSEQKIPCMPEDYQISCNCSEEESFKMATQCVANYFGSTYEF
jgi:hypothetical protein